MGLSSTTCIIYTSELILWFHYFCTLCLYLCIFSSILVREKHWAVFEHFRSFPVKLMLFPQDIKITIIFHEKIKTKLNRPLHVSIIERGKQNNRSFRELSSGVSKLLHLLLLFCYTKYVLLVSTLNCQLCWDIVLKNASLYFTCETVYLFNNTIIIKPDMKNKY